MGGASEDTSSTAQARKRRMERRGKKPQGEEATKKPRLYSEDEPSVSDSEESTFTPSSTTTKLSKDALAKIPGIKKQARYVPAVPMTKEELTLWRKEARRVRNRESAAASRQKTQSRISELEEEVGTLTKKYEAALRRIVELEAAVAAGGSAWKPLTAPQETRVSSPVVGPAHTVSPPLSPRDDSFSLEQPAELDWKTALYPQTATTFKISRHNACVQIPNRVVVVR
jgi:bZIP transcription factor